MELQSSPPLLLQMQSVFDHFNECRSTVRMTTGSAAFDSLIGSIRENQFYLFVVGNNKAILDGLVHGLVVNCVLSKREHGFESMAVYINNIDYYQPDKSLVLSPEKIAITAKCAGIEPKVVFKNLFVQMIYNQPHQLAVANQVSEFIESKKGDIKLLVINNLTKFFRQSKNKNYAADILKEVLGILCKVCMKNKVALVCTGDANVTSKGNNTKTDWWDIFKTYCECYRTFEGISTFFIQSHSNQTSICEDSQVCYPIHKEDRTNGTSGLIRDG